MAMTKKEREHVERLEKLVEQQQATIDVLLLNAPAPIVIQPSPRCTCTCHMGLTGCWCNCNRTITHSSTDASTPLSFVSADSYRHYRGAAL